MWNLITNTSQSAHLSMHSSIDNITYIDSFDDFQFGTSSLTTVACIVLTVIIVSLEFFSKSKESVNITAGGNNERLAPIPPGPKPFPIIGSLTVMGGYEVPYQAFDVLAKQYGPIISLRLGSVPTVVVNGIDNIKEVLITKTTHFDSRPNFRRYHDLFSGNKQNCKFHQKSDDIK